MILFITT